MKLAAPPPSPPSGPDSVTAPDCLIPSGWIGDIRSNLRGEEEGGGTGGRLSGDEEQWDRQDQSVCRRPPEEEEPSFQSVSGNHTIQQVR